MKCYLETHSVNSCQKVFVAWENKPMSITIAARALSKTNFSTTSLTIQCRKSTQSCQSFTYSEGGTLTENIERGRVKL